jgi:hypothetical protein
MNLLGEFGESFCTYRAEFARHFRPLVGEPPLARARVASLRKARDLGQKPRVPDRRPQPQTMENEARAGAWKQVHNLRSKCTTRPTDLCTLAEAEGLATGRRGPRLRAPAAKWRSDHRFRSVSAIHRAISRYTCPSLTRLRAPIESETRGFAMAWEERAETRPFAYMNLPHSRARGKKGCRP